MNDILAKQLALDYCCTEDDVRDGSNHFTIYRHIDGRRRWHNDSECFLKIAVVNGKLLFSGAEDIIRLCGERYAGTRGEWFFESDELRPLNDILHERGHRIKFVHPFYISETMSDVCTDGVRICRYEGDEILRFRGDGRFDEAFAFCEQAPDIIGISAELDGKIIGMAGASHDSPTMWQIGINIEPEARGKGIGTMLVTLLKNEVLKRGRLPFYGTAISHIASQKVALGAGFLPAWSELSVKPL